MIQNRDIIIWKGVKWSKLLTLDKYNISRFFIQLSTFSRYTHTAIYLKFKDKEYLLQSNLIDGVHILDITSETWFRDNIVNNIYDLYRFSDNKINKFQDFITSKINYMYKNNVNKLSIAKYNKLGIANQFLFQFFNLSLIKKSSDNKFCSELSYYYFTEDIESFKISPYDLVDSDLFIKIK